MKKTQEDFYPTLSEASAAARSLGFFSSTSYQLGYSKDDMLHSNPHTFYEDWISWEDFLQLESITPYETIQDAQKAAEGLKIESSTEYQEQYKKDPRLPSNPDKYYSKDWLNWPHFLGTKTKIKKQYYQNIEDAKKAVFKIGGINSARSYKERRGLDIRLHSNPNVIYKSEWKGWADFTSDSAGSDKKCA